MTAFGSASEVSARILVVDQGEAVPAVAAVLDRSGRACESSPSFEDATARIETEDFAMVIADHGLAPKEALDALARLSAERGVATVMVAGEGVVAAPAPDAYGYIVAPFTDPSVLLTVDAALRRRAATLEGRANQQRLEQMVVERSSELWGYVTKLEQVEKDVRLLQEEFIHRLSVAAEFKDDESPRHIQRMSQFCALIADGLGWGPERAEHIRIASVMHDVGKIGIPDHILLKPGKLTAAEWEVMKRHCEIGYRILGSNSGLMNTAAQIALTHHERTDGSGYPRGLQGDEIPIEGRIAAVADVFDSLTSDKVYRKAASVSEAESFLRDGRGTHFDPELVDVFLSEKARILGIRERYADVDIEAAELNPLSALVAES